MPLFTESKKAVFITIEVTKKSVPRNARTEPPINQNFGLPVLMQGRNRIGNELESVKLKNFQIGDTFLFSFYSIFNAVPIAGSPNVLDAT